MSSSTARSEALYANASALIPAGVSSPVRAFRKVGGAPRYLARGAGAVVQDEDNNSYIDFCMAWGPLILGHAHPAVVEAVCRAARDGLAFGAAHRDEGAVAGLVLQAFPWAERVRFVVSGTEAVLTAVRLARAATGRSLLLKFAGCYHGHVDALLVKAGSGVVTQGLADSAGVTPGVAQDTLVAPLGDDEALEQVFRTYGDQIAAVILEPLPANNGLLIQERAWLDKLAKKARAHGALLIFDEVITGFRFGFHGFGRVLGIEPDLTTLGKIVGGGLPVAAVLGKGALMDQLAPLGPVYQAGTMAGNPVALAAGRATLEQLQDGRVHAHIRSLGERFDRRLAERTLSGPLMVHRVGGVLWPLFSEVAPREADQIPAEAIQRYHASYAGWLDRGLYLPPSGYEVCFLSGAHEVAHVDALVDALVEATR